MASEESSWMAYLLTQETSNKKEEKSEGEEGEKEEEADKAKKPKVKKSEGSEFVIIEPIKALEYRFEEVTEYLISKKGNKIAFIATKNDSLEKTEVSVFDTKKQETKVIFEGYGISKKMSFDEAGDQLVFMYSSDTAKTKIYEVMYWDVKADQANTLISANTEGMPEDWSPKCSWKHKLL